MDGRGREPQQYTEKELVNSPRQRAVCVCVWHEVLQKLRTHHGLACTNTNVLTICVHPANMLVTHEDGYFVIGLRCKCAGACYDKLQVDLL